MTKYFGRAYELAIRNSAGGVRVFDGIPTAENSPLQITFTVDQTPSSRRAYAEITIYGLNRKSRESVYEQFAQVTLKAGYQNAVGTIFEGNIENIEIGRQGSDTFVKLFCQAASGAFANIDISRSFGENTPQKEIIQAVAETFGLSVRFIGDFDSLPRALKGRSIDGPSQFILDSLSRSFAFDWFALNGEMLIVKEGSGFTAPPYRYKPTNGLIGTPEITEIGVDIKVLMNPFIRPYDQYTVESETGQLTFNAIYYKRREFPKTNGTGTNRVLSLVHEGDFYGDTWTTTLRGLRVDG